MSHQKEERELFEQCLDLPRAKRWAFLENACGRDETLKKRITRLLEAHEEAEPELFDWKVGGENPLSRGKGTPYCNRCQQALPAELSAECLHCGAERPALGWPTDPYVGKKVASDQYQVIRRIGAGGFGVVYEVETVVGNLKRALKVLHQRWLHEEQVCRRFINEAVALERINHPNVARCFSAGKLDGDGRLYLLFELIEGVPLSRLLSPSRGPGGPLPPGRSLRLARQIGSGLVAAHAQGILHRDLKPSNIIVLDGKDGRERIKLLDFGIAKFVQGSASWTAGFLGTPAYMAPEQFSQRFEVGVSLDLWQLGATLFTMLTGRAPYRPEKDSIEAYIDSHRPPGVPGPSPSEVRPEMLKECPSLDALVSRLLSTDPADRPSSAAAVCDQLAKIEREGGGESEKGDLRD